MLIPEFPQSQRLSDFVLGPGGDIAIEALLGRYKSDFQVALVPPVDKPTAKLFRRYISRSSRFPDRTSGALLIARNEEKQDLDVVTDRERKNPNGPSHCSQILRKERQNFEVAHPNGHDSMLDVNESNDYLISSGACLEPQIWLKEQQGQGQGNNSLRFSEILNRKRQNSGSDTSTYDLQAAKGAWASKSTTTKRRKTVAEEHPETRTFVRSQWRIYPCFTDDDKLSKDQNSFDDNFEKSRRQLDFESSLQESSLSKTSSDRLRGSKDGVDSSVLTSHHFQAPVTYLSSQNWSPAFLPQGHTSDSYWEPQFNPEVGNSRVDGNSHAHATGNLQRYFEGGASDNMEPRVLTQQEHSILEQLEYRLGMLWMDAANKTKDTNTLASSRTYPNDLLTTSNGRVVGQARNDEQDASLASWRLEDYFQPGELGDFDMSANTLVGAENLNTNFEIIMIDKTTNEIFYAPLDTFDPRPTIEAERANEKQSIDNGYRNRLMSQKRFTLDNSIYPVQESIMGDETMTDEELDALWNHFIQISPDATCDWEAL